MTTTEIYSTSNTRTGAELEHDARILAASLDRDYDTMTGYERQSWLAAVNAGITAETSAPASVTDVNEVEIAEGARVEYVGSDEGLNGLLGTVEQIYRHGVAIVAIVEFDSHPGEVHDILPAHLAVQS